MDDNNCKGNCAGEGCENSCDKGGCDCCDAVEMESCVPQSEALVAKIKQLSADYENFRKRSEREKTRMYDSGKISVVEALLPVLDNFALAMKNADSDDGFVKGVAMIQSQLTHILDELGVKRIAALGETFDIKYHNAVNHIEDEDAGEQEIVQELQAGYIYKEEVIRHSMVVVAN